MGSVWARLAEFALGPVQQITGIDGRQPTFYVRDIPVYGDTILAPMAGFSDVPFRRICRQFGSAMQYTEFVAVEMLLSKKPNRFWDLLKFSEGEYPRTMQIFGNDSGKILEAALRIQDWGTEIIDINMGCSTRQVSGRGAGVGMMRHPALIARAFQLLTQHLSVPVTGKIRLGWNDNQNYLEVGRILEENGAALVAIHPRTKEQKYAGKANWRAIGELKAALSIPVLGNGDIKTPEDIDAMLAHTGCDGVMIGRQAIGNPWLFAHKRRSDLKPGEFFQTIRAHLEAMIQYHGLPHGLFRFRKHIKRYFAGMPQVDPYLERLTRTKELAQFETLLDQAEELWEEINALPMPA